MRFSFLWTSLRTWEGRLLEKYWLACLFYNVIRFFLFPLLSELGISNRFTNFFLFSPWQIWRQRWGIREGVNLWNRRFSYSGERGGDWDVLESKTRRSLSVCAAAYGRKSHLEPIAVWLQLPREKGPHSNQIVSLGEEASPISCSTHSFPPSAWFPRKQMKEREWFFFPPNCLFFSVNFLHWILITLCFYGHLGFMYLCCVLGSSPPQLTKEDMKTCFPRNMR